MNSLNTSLFQNALMNSISFDLRRYFCVTWEAVVITHFVDESETREVWWFAQDHTAGTVRTETSILLLYLVFLHSKVHNPLSEILKPKQKQHKSIFFFPNSFDGKIFTYLDLVLAIKPVSRWREALFVLFRENVRMFFTKILMCSVAGCCPKSVCYIYCISHIVFLQSLPKKFWFQKHNTRVLDDNCNSEVDSLCHLTERGNKVFPLTRDSG